MRRYRRRGGGGISCCARLWERVNPAKNGVASASTATHPEGESFVVNVKEMLPFHGAALARSHHDDPEP